MEIKSRYLYFFKETGCGVCAEAEPVLDSWATSHFGELFVIRLDVRFVDWEKFGYKPRKVPAYLYVVNEHPVAKFEGGLMRTKDIDRFIKDSHKLIGVSP